MVKKMNPRPSVVKCFSNATEDGDAGLNAPTMWALKAHLSWFIGFNWVLSATLLDIKRYESPNPLSNPRYCAACCGD